MNPPLVLGVLKTRGAFFIGIPLIVHSGTCFRRKRTLNFQNFRHYGRIPPQEAKFAPQARPILSPRTQMTSSGFGSNFRSHQINYQGGGGHTGRGSYRLIYPDNTLKPGFFARFACAFFGQKIRSNLGVFFLQNLNKCFG